MDFHDFQIRKISNLVPVSRGSELGKYPIEIDSIGPISASSIINSSFPFLSKQLFPEFPELFNKTGFELIFEPRKIK